MVVRARRSRLSELADNAELRQLVDAKLAEFWSPEQVAGWLRVEHPDEPSTWVTHEASYLAFYAKQLTS